jgi:segregation and condensation protein B
MYMELSVIIPHIEALIFASEKPLAVADITELLNSALGFIEDRATPEQVEAAIQAINEKYTSAFYAFEVVESGGGWQFLTKKEYHKTIAQLYGDKFLKKLSVAAIETLAIIAYKQPVTKSEIELIRGVNCDYAVQKLLEKELVVIAGRKEDAVGKPLIYATSKTFMDYFGINSSDDLPKIKEILNHELIEATRVERNEMIAEDAAPVAVTEAEPVPFTEMDQTVIIDHVEIEAETVEGMDEENVIENNQRAEADTTTSSEEETDTMLQTEEQSPEEENPAV